MFAIQETFVSWLYVAFGNFVSFFYKCYHCVATVSGFKYNKVIQIKMTNSNWYLEEAFFVSSEIWKHSHLLMNHLFCF